MNEIQVTVTESEIQHDKGHYIVACTFVYPDRNDRATRAVIHGRGRDLGECMIDFENTTRKMAGVFSRLVEESVHRLRRQGKGANDEHRPQIAALTGDAPQHDPPAPPPAVPEPQYVELVDAMSRQDLIEIALAEEADLPELRHNTAKAVIRDAILAHRERRKAAAAEGRKEPF